MSTPVQATAYVQDPANNSEPVWAEATATPTSVTFFPDDGTAPVVCDLADAEVPFDPAGSSELVDVRPVGGRGPACCFGKSLNEKGIDPDSRM